MKKCLLFLGLLMCVNVQAGEVYRSIDDSGKVHYSDSPLVGSDDVQELKLGNPPIPNENLPYETQRAMKNFPVTLYTFPDCAAACQSGRDLLNKRGIPYTEKSLVTQEDMEAFRKASGSGNLPAVTIGKTWLRGFLAEQWNKELDFAGYPKEDLAYHPPKPAAASATQPVQ